MASPLIPQDLYNQILANVPIACVDVAVVSNGSVLLVKRNDPPAKGDWWVPGGRVRKGEMRKATARRKALEELGIDCHVGPVVYTAETIFPDGPHGIAVHSINSCFLLYPVETSSRPGPARRPPCRVAMGRRGPAEPSSLRHELSPGGGA